MAKPKMTAPRRLVLAVLGDQPNTDHYGFDVARSAGLRGGTVYPMLRDFVDYGWVTSHWEDIDPEVEGRGRRKYYRLTATGAAIAAEALAQVRASSFTLQPLHVRA